MFNSPAYLRTSVRVLAYQAQAPKLKADMIEMESLLKRNYENAAMGNYTLWETGPEVALEILRASTKCRRMNALISS